VRASVAVAAAVAALAAAGGVLAASGASVPGFAGCRSFVVPRPVLLMRPRSILVACGDGNFYVTELRWTRWDARDADGAGSGHLNDCTPYCAAGHFHVYPVAVRLDLARVCGARPVREFTRLSWSFPGRRPAGVLPRGSETFRCR